MAGGSKAALLVLVVMAVSFVPSASAQEVALATALPGHREASAWYGHSAIVVSYEDGRQDYYTYRLAWADGVPRAISSAMGLSTFRLDRLSLEAAVEDYDRQGRALRLTPLPLTGGDAAALAARLDGERERTHMQPYVYDAIADNCATRLRDLLDEAFHGALAEATIGVPFGTARQAFEPYIAHDPATRYGLALLTGPVVERPMDQWEAMFLPLELERHVQSLDGVPTAIVVQRAADDVLQTPGMALGWVPAAAGVLLAALGLGVQRQRLPAWVMPAAVGTTSLVLWLPAAFLLLLWVGTAQGYWADNGNVLLLSPVVLGLPVAAAAWWRGHRQAMTSLLETQALLTGAAILLLLAPGGPVRAGVVLALAPLHLGAWLGDRLSLKAPA